MGHPVQRSTTNKGLNNLRLQLARRQVVTENRFETKHTRFRQRTPVIPGSLFPSFSTDFACSAYRPWLYISRSFLRAWSDSWFGKRKGQMKEQEHFDIKDRAE
jgi:hypothetical protein